MTGGFLNLLKPPGISSHKIVLAVRRLLGIKKIGHLGTLDPLAAGVLPLAVGTATKLISQLPPQKKIYWAEIELGIKTSTDDAEGEILQTSEVPPLSIELIEEKLEKFRGEIEQTPPIYSAIHHQGERLYKLARKGISLTPAKRNIEIYSLQLLEYAPDRIFLLVECSPGTYLRALARDMGEQLGCGGYLKFLIRVQSGNFRLEESLTFEEIKRILEKEGPENLLLPPGRVI